MKKISYKNKNFTKKLDELFQRDSNLSDIEPGVKKILDDVKSRGDSALREYAKKFDGATLKKEQFKVSKEEISAASRQIDKNCKDAINSALRNITAFASKRLPKPWSYSPRPGVIIGERFETMERVGVYIPGGTAPLVSTVIHTAGIAKAAGVEEIVAVTPPSKDGSVNPAIIYALEQSGVKEIYRLGGVYGIGAIAYGTPTVPKVEKIVGPGNSYVAAAKKMVYGEVAIDMVAGPSEIMIIADSDSNPEFIAADMLSQAEHGSGDEQAVLVSDSADLLKDALKCLREQAKKCSRSESIEKVLENGVFAIEVENLDQAAEIASRYAPEHLEIMCNRPGQLAKKVKAAGAIFLGQWTPEAVGDFVAGPSHVLPTSGSARWFAGLTVESFFRRTSIVNYQKNALKAELPTIAKFAEMEGLDAHGNSAAIRFK